MSEITLQPTRTAPRFTRKALLVLVGGGIVLFLAVLALTAYAPHFRGADNGRANALSNGATGFSGIIELSRMTGREPSVVRDEREWNGRAMLVITPENGYVDIGEATSREAITLVVFPKWETTSVPMRPGWVAKRGLLDQDNVEATLAPLFNLDISRARSGTTPRLKDQVAVISADAFTVPDRLQTFRQEAGDDVQLEPLITDGEGNIVLGEANKIYVLADPDLLNNMGMADAQGAAEALRLLDWLDPEGGRAIMYDVTLNGYGAAPDVLTAAFNPPFLAMTLALLALAAFLGLRTLTRFGAADAPERALPLGSKALADSTAALFAKANRSWTLGDRYADAVRAKAARDFGAPGHLRGTALDAYLDRLGGSPVFSERVRSADAARTDEELLSAARSLADWKKERA